ncbi:MAG: VWA domain-containing protein [Proteobacteria bacterium]|nr:VWA domain-containing protein [Pseudomonadota bacterium]
MIILVAIWLMPGILLAAAKYDDIRIVVDVSGSMKKTDPLNLRIPALKLLNGLIPNGSRAGVRTFGRYVNMTVKWGRVDDAWRKRADRGADQIHSNGLFTNIEKALARVSQGWEKSDPDTRRNIILLTDGKVDISRDSEKNKLSRENILTDSIQKLKLVSVKVHAVALSKNTDEVLLKRIALETGGSFEIAETAQQLQKLFFKMFERATKPDSVRLEDNQFVIDKSIKEMTLLIFRQPGSKHTLLYPPESNAISAGKPGNSVWRSDDGYDLITIKKPGNYALSIKAREEYLHPESLIATVRLEAPDGTGQDIIMEQSSVGWTANIKTFQNGIYQALIHINGETATGKNIQLNLGKFPLLGVYREAVVKEPDPAVKEIELVAEITEDTGTIDQPDWILTAIIVGLANFGLILGGFVAWFIWRRKKSAPELTLEDEGVNA